MISNMSRLETKEQDHINNKRTSPAKKQQQSDSISASCHDKQRIQNNITSGQKKNGSPPSSSSGRRDHNINTEEEGHRGIQFFEVATVPANKFKYQDDNRDEKMTKKKEERLSQNRRTAQQRRNRNRIYLEQLQIQKNILREENVRLQNERQMLKAQQSRLTSILAQNKTSQSNPQQLQRHHQQHQQHQHQQPWQLQSQQQKTSHQQQQQQPQQQPQPQQQLSNLHKEHQYQNHQLIRQQQQQLPQQLQLLRHQEQQIRNTAQQQSIMNQGAPRPSQHNHVYLPHNCISNESAFIPIPPMIASQRQEQNLLKQQQCHLPPSSNTTTTPPSPGKHPQQPRQPELIRQPHQQEIGATTRSGGHQQVTGICNEGGEGLWGGKSSARTMMLTPNAVVSSTTATRRNAGMIRTAPVVRHVPNSLSPGGLQQLQLQMQHQHKQELSFSSLMNQHTSQQPNRSFHVQQNEAELEKSQKNASFGAATTQQVEINTTGTSSLLWDNEEEKEH